MTRKPLVISGLLVLVVAGLVWILQPWKGDEAFGESRAADSSRAAAADTTDSKKTGTDTESAEKLDEEEPSEPSRKRVAATTVLRGRFRGPGGVWPGGGKAAIKPASAEPEGGLAGLLSGVLNQAGSAGAKQGQEGEKDPEAEIERSFKGWLGMLPSVAEQNVEQDGRFVFEDPPVGRFELTLEHPSMRLTTVVAFEIEKGKELDLGWIDTEPGGGLLVLVADLAGRPIPGAKLGLNKELDMKSFMNPSVLEDLPAVFRGMIPREGRTDERGSYLFGGLPPAESWELTVRAADFAPETRDVHVPPRGQGIVRVELTKGASLKVLVRDDKGQPVEGARLRLRFPGQDSPGRGGRRGGGRGLRIGVTDGAQRRKLETDKNGIAEETGLPGGKATLRSRPQGYLPVREEVHLVTGEETSVELTLDPGEAISGRVVDEEDEPIPTAKVRYEPELGQKVMGFDVGDIIGVEIFSSDLFKDGIDVDEEGRFSIGGFKKDQKPELIAGAPGFTIARSGPLEVGSGDNEIRLERAAELSGIVLRSEDGAPVEEYTISCKKVTFLVLELAVRKQKFAGSGDGSFVLDGIPREALTVHVDAPGRGPWSRSVDFRAGPADLGEIRLGPPAGIEGRTVDPTGLPLPGVSVRVAKGGVADSRFMSKLLGRKIIESDEKGVFRLEGLPARRIKLIAEKDGYAPIRSKAIRVQAGKVTKGVILQLSAGGSLLGRVRDTQGRPLEGWNIQAETMNQSHLKFAETDENGEFVMKGLMAGTYKIEGFPRDFMDRIAALREFDPDENDGGQVDMTALITAARRNLVTDRVVIREGEQSEVTLVFREQELPKGLAVVKGYVTVGGRPLEEGTVFLGEPGSALQGVVGRVKDGNFRIDGVLPGTYRVQVTRNLFAGMIGTPKNVHIPKTASHRLDLRLPGGRIAGRAIYRDGGSPAAGALMSLRSSGEAGTLYARAEPGDGSAMTDSDGRFYFEGLSGGTYDLVAKELIFGRGRSGRIANLELPEGGSLEDLTLHLDRGAAVEAGIRDSLGPKANAVVQLLRADGQPLDFFHRALTDAEGEVQISGLPAGTYRLSVDAPGSASWVSEPVRLANNGKERVEVFLEPGVPCRIRVTGTLPSTRPGEIIVYSVWQPDGALLRTGRLPVPSGLRSGSKVDRSYGIGKLKPGRYRLRLESASLGVFSEEREVPRSGKAEWTVELDGKRFSSK